MRKQMIAMLAFVSLVLNAWGLETASGFRNVMVLGDSITHLGYFTQDLQLLQNLWHPGSGIRYYNVGQCGATVGAGLANFRAEVGRIRPFRVICMFGMNDVHWWQYTNDVLTTEFRELADQWHERYRQDYEKLIESVKSAGVGELVLVTPSPYDEYSSGGCRNFRNVNEYGLMAAAMIVRELADRHTLPLIDLHRVMTEACKRFPEKRLCGLDRVHPGRLGNLFMAFTCVRAMEEVGQSANVEIAANGSLICARGATVSCVEDAKECISFDYLPERLPFPDLPEFIELKAMYPEFQDFNREMLKIKGLASGKWKMKFYYKTESVDAVDLENGINLAEKPTANRRLANAAAEAMSGLQIFDRLRRDSSCNGLKKERVALDAQEDALQSALCLRPVPFHVEFRLEEVR